MDALRQALEAAIIEERDNPVPRLVLADLCEEQGEDDLASAYRSLANKQPDHATAQAHDGMSWDWWMEVTYPTMPSRCLPKEVFSELPKGSGPHNSREDFIEYQSVVQAMEAFLQAIQRAVTKGWKPS